MDVVVVVSELMDEYGGVEDFGYVVIAFLFVVFLFVVFFAVFCFS